MVAPFSPAVMGSVDLHIYPTRKSTPPYSFYYSHRGAPGQIWPPEQLRIPPPTPPPPLLIERWTCQPRTSIGSVQQPLVRGRGRHGGSNLSFVDDPICPYAQSYLGYRSQKNTASMLKDYCVLRMGANIITMFLPGFGTRCRSRPHLPHQPSP